MGIKPPCKDCTKRYTDGTTTCHSTCKEYKAFVEQNDKLRTAIQNETNGRALNGAKQWSRNGIAVHRRRKDGKR